MKARLLISGSTMIILSVLLTLTESAAQPISGCYIGAYPGCGSVDISCTNAGAFNAATGKSHHCFSRYINAGSDTDLLNPAHWLWADTLKAEGSRPLFFLMPYGQLQDYSNGSRDAVLTQFAQSCAAYQQTVYLVFGHEMNGAWYPWGQDSANYIPAFQHVSTLMKGIAPNIMFCWVPVQGWGVHPYAPYWPGNSVVDWVGLTLYDRDWDENNLLGPGHIQAAIEHLDFYQQFSANTAKPMMIAETGYFDPNLDPTAPGVRVPLSDSMQAVVKNQWIAQLYDTALLRNHFPNLNMIIWFHVRKMEPDVTTQGHWFGTLDVDWRIPLEPWSNIYSGLIQDPWFIGGTPTAIPKPTPKQKDTGAWLKVYPNPARDYVTIEYYLEERDYHSIILIDSNGKTVANLVNRQIGQGLMRSTFPISHLHSGTYAVRLKADHLISIKESLLLIKLD